MKQWKFDRRECRNGQVRAMLKGGNGETVLPTEQYQRKAGLEKGIAAIKANASNPKAYLRYLNNEGRPYFCLKSVGNNKIIAGPSQAYSCSEAMDDTIAQMILNGSDAKDVTSIGLFYLSFENKYGERDQA